MGGIKTIDELFGDAREAADAVFAATICGTGRVDVLKEALQRFPQHAEFYESKLGTLCFEGAVDGSVGCLENALHHLGKSVDAPERTGNKALRSQLDRDAVVTRNMLAIIYLAKSQGENAKAVLEEARGIKSLYRNAGTDALYAYSCILTGDAKTAMNTTEESLGLLSKLKRPDSTIVTHDLASNAMAQALLKGSEAAVERFNKWLSSYNSALVRDGVLSQLDKIYGTHEPSRIAQLTPTSDFKQLRWLRYGHYQEPSD